MIPLPVVFDLANALPRWDHALVLLATFAQLRFGELAALTRDHLWRKACIACGVPDAHFHDYADVCVAIPPGGMTRMGSLRVPIPSIELRSLQGS